MAIHENLKELINRVSSTYSFPEEYLGDGKRGGEILRYYEKRDEALFSKDVASLESVLKNIKAEQVVAIATKGLILGAWAMELGYDPVVIEAHHISRDFDTGSSKFFRNRNKKISVYFIRPKKVIDGVKIYDPLDLTTIGNQKSEWSLAVGILEVDSLEPNKRTVVLDDTIDRGMVIPVVNKYLLDKGDVNCGNVVYSLANPHPKLKEFVIELKQKTEIEN